jgi:hypothetical protein
MISLCFDSLKILPQDKHNSESMMVKVSPYQVLPELSGWDTVNLDGARWSNLWLACRSCCQERNARVTIMSPWAVPSFQ